MIDAGAIGQGSKPLDSCAIFEKKITSPYRDAGRGVVVDKSYVQNVTGECSQEA